MTNVRLSRSSVGAEESAALARVIAAGYLGMGEEVRLFEEEIAAMIGGDRHVVCVATGTAALHLAMASLDIGPGHEVLVPSITYLASFQAVSATGARPVPCDVREDDVFIDLKSAEQRLTANTRAIMPVHYASSARGLAEVYAFADANGLRIIEDAAHAFGCSIGGVPVGARGDVLCFSFDGIKNITSGEGGAIVTGDAEVARRARDGRLLGVEKDTEARYRAKRSWTFDVHHQGFRYHMSNLMAAVGREQLKKLPRFSEHRCALAKRYRRELGQMRGLSLLDLDWSNVVPHIFVVRVHGGQRDALGAHLEAKGIEWGFHYQPNHQLSFFRGDACPKSDQLGTELFSIPLHGELTDEEQARVIAAIQDFSGDGLMTKVSVIMNCLNGERYVREAIQSIYDQTFQDWEIIFWDNASRDGTAEIARSFDERLRYFRSESTMPLGAARRLAMAQASGKWIAFQDHDDVSLPHRIERQLAAIGTVDYAFCYGGMREIDETGTVIRDVRPSYPSGDQFGQQLAQFEANLQTTIVNSGYLNRYDIDMDESFVMFEDYNLFMKLAAKGPVCAVGDILCLCRLLPSSWTEKSLERHAGERFATLDQICAANPGIEARYPEAFREARARGFYYKARYEMQSGRAAAARNTLRPLVGLSPIYRILYWLSWWPRAWKTLHGRNFKARLTSLFLGQ